MLILLAPARRADVGCRSTYAIGVRTTKASAEGIGRAQSDAQTRAPNSSACFGTQR
jgi:hypothetical protein